MFDLFLLMILFLSLHVFLHHQKLLEAEQKRRDIVGVHCIDQQWASKVKWMVILTNQSCLIVAYLKNLVIIADHVLYSILQIPFSLVYLNR